MSLRFFLLLLILLPLKNTHAHQNPVYICTGADERYFPCLINLIGSLHKHNYDSITQIVVFDLGLLDEQKKLLSIIEHVQIYEVEKTNSYILTRFNTTHWGKQVPGWYTWKPVALKQMFDIFPEETNTIVWIDAGTTILRPLNYLFDYIAQKGYYFHSGSHWTMNQQTTQFVIEALNLNNPAHSWILNEYGLESGFMGVTKRVYNDFVLPAYHLTTDIRYFADDGTCPGGFGNCRHDQTIFSLFALLKGLHIFQHASQPTVNMSLEIDGNNHPFHIACIPSAVTDQTHVYCARFDMNPAQMAPYIHYKKKIQ